MKIAPRTGGGSPVTSVLSSYWGGGGGATLGCWGVYINGDCVSSIELNRGMGRKEISPC